MDDIPDLMLAAQVVEVCFFDFPVIHTHILIYNESSTNPTKSTESPRPRTSNPMISS